MNLKDLAKPFLPEDIEWRVGTSTADKTRALALAYVTNRAVMNRLDEVVGPQNWQNTYETWRDKGILSGLSIKVGAEWITKFDGADKTAVEATKGGFSDAMKRAAVQWGIGRYLYDLENIWVKAKPTNNGKSCVLDEIPTLPKWALPDDYKGDGKARVEATVEPEVKVPKLPTNQHKRLEVLMANKGVDREKVRETVAKIRKIHPSDKEFADIHLNQMFPAEFDVIIEKLEAKADKESE